MKSFDDFKSVITPKVLSDIEAEVLDNLNQYLDSNPFENETKQLIWFNRSFSISFTMRLIERYHNWLHES